MTKIYSERPAGSRDRKNDNGNGNGNGDEEERQYRATVVKLNLGGQSARVGAYAGVKFVPMRIVNRITTVAGVKKTAYTLEGFDPDTGRPELFFFDPRLRKGTKPEDRDYVQNWDGGLASFLGEPATEAEADEINEEVNEENGTDIEYDWSMWEAVGGILKLKPIKKGKPVQIGKEFIETKKGGFHMNVFHCDNLNPADFPDLQNDIDWYESLRGEPYSTDEEEHYGSSDSSEDYERESESEEVEVYVPEPEPEPQPAPARSSSSSRNTGQTSSKRVNTRRSRQEASEEVAKEFNQVIEKTIGDMPKSVTIPETISDFIKTGYDKQRSTDEIVLGLITEKDLKNTQAVEYLSAWLDKREGNGRSPAITRPVQPAKTEPTKPRESELVKTARECKEKGMDSPETFDVLNKKFPSVSREDKRAALKQAGLIRT